MAPQQGHPADVWIASTESGSSAQPDYEFGDPALVHEFPIDFVPNLAAQRLDSTPMAIPSYRWSHPFISLSYIPQESPAFGLSRFPQTTGSDQATQPRRVGFGNFHATTQALGYDDTQFSRGFAGVQDVRYANEISAIEQNPGPPRLRLIAPTFPNGAAARDPSPLGLSDNASHYSGSTCASASSTPAFSAGFETSSVGLQSPSEPQISTSLLGDKRAIPFDEEDSSEDAASDTGSTKRTSKRQRTEANSDRSQSTPGQNFACPFYLDNPARNNKSSCTGPGFRTIDRLREHILNRIHSKKHACLICGRPCGNPKALKQHRADGTCNSESSRLYPEQISPEQRQSLEKTLKRLRKQNGDLKWNEMWEIVKPGKPLPPSPYHKPKQEMTGDQVMEILRSLPTERMGYVLDRIYGSVPGECRWAPLLDALEAEIRQRYPGHEMPTSAPNSGSAIGVWPETRDVALCSSSPPSPSNSAPGYVVGALYGVPSNEADGRTSRF